MSQESSYTPTRRTRRSAVTSLGAGSLGLAAGIRPTRAAQAFSTAGHPLVGTWFLDNSSENRTDALDTFILHADGTYVEANADGSVRLGTWEAPVRRRRT
jgi:hypothetical protein